MFEQKGQIFETVIDKIEKDYEQSQNCIGWRFLVTSKKTLISNSGIYLITLNPGGRKVNREQPVASCERGCAYISESWKGMPVGESRLQKQFFLLFCELAKRHSIKDKIELMNSSVCGYFIPYRSVDYKSLKAKKESIALANSIWEIVLRDSDPKLIICIDNKTFKCVNSIVANLDYRKCFNRDYLVSWGDVSAELVRYEKDGKGLSLVRFPHLSRFSIFGRDNSRNAIEAILDDATAGIVNLI